MLKTIFCVRLTHAEQVFMATTNGSNFIGQNVAIIGALSTEYFLSD